MQLLRAWRGLTTVLHAAMPLTVRLVLSVMVSHPLRVTMCASPVSLRTACSAHSTLASARCVPPTTEWMEQCASCAMIVLIA